MLLLMTSTTTIHSVGLGWQSVPLSDAARVALDTRFGLLLLLTNRFSGRLHARSAHKAVTSGIDLVPI